MMFPILARLLPLSVLTCDIIPASTLALALPLPLVYTLAVDTTTVLLLPALLPLSLVTTCIISIAILFLPLFSSASLIPISSWKTPPEGDYHQYRLVDLHGNRHCRHRHRHHHHHHQSSSSCPSPSASSASASASSPSHHHHITIASPSSPGLGFRV